MHDEISHIENWVFDLDNTLYPAGCGLYQYMDARIRRFVSRALNLPEDEAHKVQKGYFRSHGTTLAGMMANHGTDPHEYLEDVHQFPLEALADAPRLADRIAALPGRKFIFTNADALYAKRALSALGLDDIFEAIVDIHACNYQPKPATSAYETLLDITGINPARSIFFEDMARNLAPAKARGMTTVWINNGSELGDLADDFGHVDHRTDCLAAWLDGAIEALESQPA